MTPEFVVEFAKQAIILTINLSMPMLGLGLAAGLIISVFQAVTSIQEMTLTFVPKIFAAVLAVVIFGPWMLRLMVSYTTQLISNIPMYVR